MARPKKLIDPEQVKKLAAINCNFDEIAAVMSCSVDTLQRRFAALIKEGRDQGRMSLKRKMWETAMNGNVTMMIWLSKQMLGYTEKIEEKTEAQFKAQIHYKAKWGATQEPTDGKDTD